MIEHEIKWEDHFYYDEGSPSGLRWNRDVRTGMNLQILKIKKGDIAGHKLARTGRYSVMLERKHYYSHRIVYEIFNGKIPENMQIDHIDCNPENNKIENLRVVTPKINTRNKRLQKNNSTGVTGVRFNSKENSFIAMWVSETSGKQTQKSYSANKYGKEVAFEMACNHRKSMIEYLNTSGAGYTALHGS